MFLKLIFTANKKDKPKHFAPGGLFPPTLLLVLYSLNIHLSFPEMSEVDIRQTYILLIKFLEISGNIEIVDFCSVLLTVC